MLTPCTHGHVRLSVLRAGRWLRVEHPTITEPAAWPRELCTAYVAAIDRIHVEDFAQRCDPPHDRLGHPLSARSKDGYLGPCASSLGTAKNGPGDSPAL